MESHETPASLKSDNAEKIFLKIITVRYFYQAPPKKVNANATTKEFEMIPEDFTLTNVIRFAPKGK